MSCPAPDRVLDYLARRLDARERAAIEAHVDECAACRVLLGELARTDVDDVVAIEPEPEPATVGRYRVEGRLGDGGMGTVYAAYDPQLERRVAVKLVHPELAVRGGIERLLREGRALARLSHPNVVAVHDAGTDGDRVYVAMELVEGQTLAAWLRAAPRGWREIVGKFVAAGHGLAAAHRAGIVHRDVKPENVLLDRAGVPKVADFGLADASAPRALVATEPDVDSRLTHPGAVLGTPAFMSPEQRRGDDVGPATDQYSLCAAVWSALFGEAPARRIPAWLRAALERGLAQDPADRFPSLEALVAALDPAARARRRRILALVAGAVVLATAVTVSLVVVGTPPPDPIAAACERAASDRERLWNPQDRAAITVAFGATGARYAYDSWTYVDAAAARYLGELATAERSLCDQRPRSSDARELVEAGLACLTERRDDLAILTMRLRVAQPADVQLAVKLVHSLDPVMECANQSTLAEERAARATPALAATRTAVWRAIRDTRTAMANGAYPEGSALARHAVELARPLGGALLAKALLVATEAVTDTEGVRAGDALARESVIAAEAAHSDELRAYAMSLLLNSVARQPGREREALAMQPLVEAAMTRTGERASLLPPMHQSIGIAHLQLGEYTEALASFEASLAAARAIVPSTDPRMPDYIYPVGLALDYLRRDREAVEKFDEAVRAANAVWGENHPAAARYTLNLATKHATLGDCPRAIAELAKARAILTGVLPPASNEHLQITELIGTCHYFLHRYPEALREHDARRRTLEDAGRAKSTEMVQVLVDIGDVKLDQAEPAAARDSFARAVAMLEGIVGTTDARLAGPLARLGDAQLQAGDPAARATLERSLALFEQAHLPAPTAADARFPLARAVWPTDRARARTLAEAARAGYAAGPPILAPRLRAVEAWLAAHR